MCYQRSKNSYFSKNFKKLMKKRGKFIFPFNCLTEVLILSASMWNGFTSLSFGNNWFYSLVLLINEFHLKLLCENMSFEFMHELRHNEFYILVRSMLRNKFASRKRWCLWLDSDVIKNKLISDVIKTTFCIN